MRVLLLAFVFFTCLGLVSSWLVVLIYSDLPILVQMPISGLIGALIVLLWDGAIKARRIDGRD